MSSDITITFPDGNTRPIKAGMTGAGLAASISKSLAKKAVAMVVDGEVCDLADPLTRDCTVKILARSDAEALELIRHDCAHVLAEAVQEIWPDAQVTIGPVIEHGFFYDFKKEPAFTPEDFEQIEAKMAEIIKRDKPFTKEVWTRDKARTFFEDKGEHYKVELLDAIPDGEDVKMYAQGDWIDLCRGPHMTTTGKVGDAFKLLRTAGAYWRGDSDNEMLSRIYGTAFASRAELQAYLDMLEEAERRDHRRLGREMDLFHFQEEAPGSVFWHDKGWTLFQELMNYMRRRQRTGGYQEVNSPDMMERGLWEKSGHWEKFGENMFTTQTPDERVFCCKPMNCPGHVQIFKNGLKSYRELPMRIGEFGKVHRYEPSGALHGLMRVRHFTQDDAHIFCTHEQITEECVRVNDYILSIYKDFGFEDVTIKFSDRPEKRVGSDEVWDASEAALKTAIDAAGQPWTLNPGEGAFYGPKLEYVLRDAIGRDWQCGTLQVDFNLPDRLGAFYIAEDGEKHVPVMLHVAKFGSLERFTGILIENFAGALPFWLAPTQVSVCTIVSDADAYATDVTAQVEKAGLRPVLDLRNEKINRKVREHSLSKVPVIFAIGKREAEEGTVSVRRLGSRDQQVLPLAEVIETLRGEAVPPDLKGA
ncbi:MAG: threonine--tRNA ligase [Pseudomonadota bacterium]